MDVIQLTQLFVKYAETQTLLNELKAQIETEILARKDSVKIAGVKATYYQPSSGTPKYEEAAIEFIGKHPEYKAILKEYQTTIVSTKWKEFCGFYNIEAQPGEEKPARVVVK
jgi:hypothetical protein